MIYVLRPICQSFPCSFGIHFLQKCQSHSVEKGIITWR